MDWLAALAAAGITGLLALAGTALQHAAPRELRRARQLSAELKAMKADSPAARLAEAARDDLVTASVIRTIVTPWSLARGVTFALIGAALALAVAALVPMTYGLLATASGTPDDIATALTVMLGGGSLLLLLVALVPATYAGRQIKRLKARFRATWQLPDALQMEGFSDEVPAPRAAPRP